MSHDGEIVQRFQDYGIQLFSKYELFEKGAEFETLLDKKEYAKSFALFSSFLQEHPLEYNENNTMVADFFYTFIY